MYSLNGVDLADYGILIKEFRGYLDMPKRMGDTEQSWPDENGIEAFTDADDIRFEGRDLTLIGYFESGSHLQMISTVQNFYNDVDAFTGLVDLVTPYGTYEVYLPQGAKAELIRNKFSNLEIRFREPVQTEISLECTNSGTTYKASTQAYGVWKFDIYKDSDLNTANTQFISSSANDLSNTNGYYLQLSVNEEINLWRANNEGGGTSFTSLFRTSHSYIQNNIWYRIKIIRLPNGGFSAYIKGGLFGIDYTLISVLSGSNPVIDNTYITSNYFMVDNDTGDEIKQIFLNNNYFSTSDFTDGTGTYINKYIPISNIIGTGSGVTGYGIDDFDFWTNYNIRITEVFGKYSLPKMKSFKPVQYDSESSAVSKFETKDLIVKGYCEDLTKIPNLYALLASSGERILHLKFDKARNCYVKDGCKMIWIRKHNGTGIIEMKFRLIDPFVFVNYLQTNGGDFLNTNDSFRILIK